MTSKLVHHSEGVSGLAEAILDVVAHSTIMCDNAAKVHVGELLGGWKVFSFNFGAGCCTFSIMTSVSFWLIFKLTCPAKALRQDAFSYMC